MLALGAPTVVKVQRIHCGGLSHAVTATSKTATRSSCLVMAASLPASVGGMEPAVPLLRYHPAMAPPIRRRDANAT